MIDSIIYLIIQAAMVALVVVPFVLKGIGLKPDSSPFGGAI